MALAAALLLVSACGDDSGRVSVGKGKKFDPSLLDGGDDSGSLDGSRSDGGPSDGSVADGAARDAADDEDAGPREVDPTEACSVQDDFANYKHVTDIATEGGFSLTTGPAGFGLAYWSKTNGYAINTMPIDATGQFGKPKAVLKSSTFKDIALMWNPEGWRMAWIDNFAGSAEVETIALSDNLGVPGTAMRTTLTSNTLPEARPVLADIAGTPLLAWIAGDDVMAPRISSQRLDGKSPIVDLVSKSAGHVPVSLALTRVGKASAALAWVEEESSAHAGVWLQKIDAAGKAVGEPTSLSDRVSAGNSVDLATRDEEGGAAVYSVTIGTSHQVRFRRLDETGGFLAIEKPLIGGSLQATDASLARVSGGYVVAYRALPGGIVKEPGIYMMFISKEGNVTQHNGNLVTKLVAPASAAGGRVTVRLSTDGQILIGFLDGNGNLRLARQRLDCQ